MSTIIRILIWPLRILAPSDHRMELANDQWQLGLTVRAQASDVG